MKTPQVISPAKPGFSVESVRADFPLLATTMQGKPIAFLDNAASSQKPVQVIEAISAYYRTSHANVHRGVYTLSARATEIFEKARSTVRAFLNAKEDQEIIFTRGTTEAINLVADTFARAILEPGDEVLISALEHHSNIVPWQLACERSGAVLKVLPITDRGEWQMDALDTLLSDRTRIVALNHVSNSLGTINPVKRVIEAAHAKDIPVLLDGAQAAPHMPIDVQELGVDFYAISSHKMFGPTGIGVLYGKRAWLEKLPPYQGGGEMISRVTFEKTTYNEIPFKFEAGTPDISGAVGLEAAINYLDALDRQALLAYESNLLAYATDELSRIDGLRIIGTAGKKASVISFIVDGLHPYDIGTILDHEGIAVRTGHHCTEPLMDHYGIPGTVRASMCFYNTAEEIDRLTVATRRAINMLK